MKAGPEVDARGCDWCDKPTEGLAKALVAEMRAKHGRGGTTICRDCINRARISLPPR